MRRAFPLRFAFGLALLGPVVVAACAGGSDTGRGGSTSAGGAHAGGGGASTGPSTGGAGGATPTTANGGGTTTPGSGGTTLGTGGGCDAPTAIPDHPLETEPNDATAEALAPGAKGFTASICPIGDVDAFSFDVADGYGVHVRVTDGHGGCPANSQPLVTVFDPGGVAIASDTGFGCLALGPREIPALGAMPAGTYTVRVENAEARRIDAYALDLDVEAPACGDGVVQVAGGEQCDDENTQGGDGCSATCQLAGNYLNEVEPNDSIATATPIGGKDGAVGALPTGADVDYYSFDVAVAGSAVRALVSDGFGACPPLFDSTLTLYDPSGNPIATDDDSGPDTCSAIDPTQQPGARQLPAGTYTLSVASTLGAPTPYYVLSYQVNPPGCGDAVRGAGEQCDDGNSQSGDGCSSTCQSEPPWEIEPNDDQAHATPKWPGKSVWYGSLVPSGEVDWFSFTVQANADVTLFTNDLGNQGLCSYDTKIHLVNAQGVEIAQNDDGGVDTCSRLAPTTDPAVHQMAAGTYFVWVEEIMGFPVTGYELHIQIQ